MPRIKCCAICAAGLPRKLPRDRPQRRAWFPRKRQCEEKKMSTETGPTSLQKSLPSSYYYSPEIYAREKESIFCQEWSCAGREEDLPANGSLVVLDVVGESILRARTKEGERKAPYNGC